MIVILCLPLINNIMAGTKIIPEIYKRSHNANFSFSPLNISGIKGIIMAIAKAIKAIRKSVSIVA